MPTTMDSRVPECFPHTETANIWQQMLEIHTSPSNTNYYFGKLPPELMSTIFLLAAEKDVKSAVTLTHVCRHWRSAALATPSLWRSLSLCDRTSSLEIACLLRRTKGVVDELNLRRGCSYIHQFLSTKMLDANFWERLKKLTVAFPSDSGLEVLAPGNVERMRLHTLVLEGYLDQDILKRIRVFDSLQCIPSISITSLTVTWPTLQWMRMPAFPSLTQLVFKGTEFDAEGFLNFLMISPGIEHLVLSNVIINFSRRPVIRARTFTMTRLRSLDFDFATKSHTGQHTIHFFTQITFPTLRTLIVRNYGRVGETRPNIILTRIADSLTPDLTELRFINCKFSPISICELLIRSVVLTTLEISYYQGDIDQLLDFLSGPERLCTILQHADFSGREAILRGDGVMDFIESRLHSATPIQTLVLNRYARTSPIIPWLEENVTQVIFK